MSPPTVARSSPWKSSDPLLLHLCCIRAFSSDHMSGPTERGKSSENEEKRSPIRSPSFRGCYLDKIGILSCYTSTTHQCPSLEQSKGANLPTPTPDCECRSAPGSPFIHHVFRSLRQRPQGHRPPGSCRLALLLGPRSPCCYRQRRPLRSSVRGELSVPRLLSRRSSAL